MHRFEIFCRIFFFIFIFFRFFFDFFLFSYSFRLFQLQKWIVLTFINKSFRSLIVSILNLLIRNEIEKKREINYSNIQLRNIKNSNFQFFTLKITYKIKKKSTIDCSFVSFIFLYYQSRYFARHRYLNQTIRFVLIKKIDLFIIQIVKHFLQQQNLFCEMIKLLIQMIFFLIFRFVIISRYLQSKFTSHEKLNRVKNIFKNCRSILLNNEWWKM